jgi:adenylate cyclase
MGKEIERKFLVRDDSWRAAAGAGTTYRQGYIPTDGTSTVRVRIAGDKGYVTLKGRTTGLSRSEFEYEVPRADAQAMLEELCGREQIEKTRHLIPHGDLKWEIDVFAGANAGLIVAEIEVPSEDTEFDRPAWLGEEVSHDRRYTNAALAKSPYSTWKR